MTREKYTFSLDLRIMKEFKKHCIEIDRGFSNQVEVLIDNWVFSMNQNKEFKNKRRKQHLE